MAVVHRRRQRVRDAGTDAARVILAVAEARGDRVVQMSRSKFSRQGAT